MIARANIYGRGQCLSNGPAVAKAGHDRSSVYSCFYRPIRDAKDASVVRKKGAGSRVAKLFALGGPAAVVWLVIAVIVNSIQRGVSWAFAHVREEVFKQMPAFTYGNSSSAVMFKSAVVGVGASVPHLQPRSIFARVGLAVREGNFNALTAAGPLCARRKQRSNHGRCVAAITTTLKQHPFSVATCGADNNQFSKASSGRYIESSHGVLLSRESCVARPNRMLITSGWAVCILTQTIAGIVGTILVRR